MKTGEKIWASSIVLFGIWVLIGNSLDIPVKTISAMGSIGMILFVVIAILSVIILNKK